MGQVGSMGFERFRGWISAVACALALCAAASSDDAAAADGAPDAGAAEARDAARAGDADADAAVAAGGEGCDLSGTWAPELADLPALPDAADDPAVVDVDRDGNPGARSLITDTPVGSGVRHGLQRGWEDMAGETPRGARDFRIDIGYDFQEVALSAMPELFASGASVRKQAPHQARFLRVDADFAGSDDDATCAAVQALFPHRPEPREDW